MADLDLNRLREFLDAEERFARSIDAGDPRGAVAKKMLAIIEDVRASLRPSVDGTANYVPVKDIIEVLTALRTEVDHPDTR